MLVQSILTAKGSDVVTIADSVSLADAAATLRDHGIGALVVSNDGRHIDGIVSERDVVRALANHGATVMGRAVSTVMSRDVVTCRAGDAIEALMLAMTERRIRHVPVVTDGRLTGIISIGDVVKSSLDQLQFERDQLDSYVHQT